MLTAFSEAPAPLPKTGDCLNCRQVTVHNSLRPFAFKSYRPTFTNSPVGGKKRSCSGWMNATAAHAIATAMIVSESIRTKDESDLRLNHARGIRKQAMRKAVRERLRAINRMALPTMAAPRFRSPYRQRHKPLATPSNAMSPNDRDDPCAETRKPA